MSGVDVLAPFTRHDGESSVTDLAALEAAVRELVEACKERDEARNEYGMAVELFGEESNEKEMRAARRRIIAANKKYRLALAAFGGGQ